MRLDAVAIVPAGGAARRLAARVCGGKAGVTCGGRTLLECVCSAVAGEVSRVIVVAAPGGVLPDVSAAVEVIRDSTAGAGPLAAVRDGLRHAVAAPAPPRRAVLCSCDLPFVHPGVIRLVLERADSPGVRWAVPEVSGHPQPLLSALAVDLLPELEAFLASGGRSLRGFAAMIARDSPRAVLTVDAAEFRTVDPALDSFRDVDTPEDLAAAERVAAARPRGG